MLKKDKMPIFLTYSKFDREMLKYIIIRVINITDDDLELLKIQLFEFGVRRQKLIKELEKKKEAKLLGNEFKMGARLSLHRTFDHSLLGKDF